MGGDDVTTNARQRTISTIASARRRVAERMADDPALRRRIDIISATLLTRHPHALLARAARPATELIVFSSSATVDVIPSFRGNAHVERAATHLLTGTEGRQTRWLDIEDRDAR